MYYVILNINRRLQSIKDSIYTTASCRFQHCGNPTLSGKHLVEWQGVVQVISVITQSISRDIFYLVDRIGSSEKQWKLILLCSWDRITLLINSHYFILILFFPEVFNCMYCSHLSFYVINTTIYLCMEMSQQNSLTNWHINYCKSQKCIFVLTQLSHL